MGRRRPDWWLEQQHQQQQRDLLEDGCPRNAANARERARMRVLSKAFGRLKTTLPWVPADTKLSKLDTLRLATTYIAHLSSLLTTTERSDIADQGETGTQVAVTSTQPINYAMVNIELVTYHIDGQSRKSTAIVVFLFGDVSGHF
ncbi:transcription factor 21 isoform X2 [Aphis craccivora]|uniref:Transcription factor 21 isoform X2 n=1 Tax=Aphis craccivora TaxID=307492 RepID=A0A6G0YS83_APHCR|nr:transcription factor 21 isoform X2 [Aphis craccivora]